MPVWLLYIFAGILAYSLGSVSFGILTSRLMHGPDLRTVGSKNTGASNVQRTMGWKAGLITFFGDSLKAVLACWLGQIITGSHAGALFCGVFVVIGHNWPVFYHFKGGKGVASSCGVLVFCFPIPALISIALGICVIAVTKYISVGSMTILTSYALIVSVFYSHGDFRIILWAWLLAAMCIIRHHANISRLINGNENKLGQKAVSSIKEDE